MSKSEKSGGGFYAGLIKFVFAATAICLAVLYLSVLIPAATKVSLREVMDAGFLTSIHSQTQSGILDNYKDMWGK